MRLCRLVVCIMSMRVRALECAYVCVCGQHLGGVGPRQTIPHFDCCLWVVRGSAWGEHVRKYVFE